MRGDFLAAIDATTLVWTLVVLFCLFFDVGLLECVTILVGLMLPTTRWLVIFDMGLRGIILRTTYCPLWSPFVLSQSSPEAAAMAWFDMFSILWLTWPMPVPAESPYTILPLPKTISAVPILLIIVFGKTVSSTIIISPLLASVLVFASKLCAAGFCERSYFSGEDLTEVFCRIAVWDMLTLKLA